MDDTDIELSSIQGGDAAAFGRWMGRVEPTLRLSLRSFAASVDVEAVLQEALLRTWNVAPDVQSDGKPNSLFRVALRIGRNLAISEARRARRHAPEELLASLPDDASLPHDPMLLARVMDCHSKLPQKPREALDARLASAGGEADEVLAARLSMRPNTFLQNFTRARKFLLDCLGAMGVDLAELT
ncbi:MAG: hypothetical protein IPG50_25255 [Myxococcales bacterium]|nr:hypothetical protein [Myxococcales bacterium]